MTMNKVLAGYLLLVMVVIIYYPTSYLFFASPDDPWMLLKNDLIHPDKFSLFTVLRAPGDIQYSPLNTLYYYLIYQINGYDPYYFHLFSLLIHLANIGLVYVLIKQLLNAFDIDKAELVAYIVTFVWAVHPFNVEVVAWIAASKVLLFSFFALSSLILFVKRRLVLSMLCFVGSCLCKEQAMVMPFLYMSFLAFKYLHKGTRINTAMVLWLALCLVVTAGSCFIFLRLNDESFPVPVAHYSLWERVILSFYCLRFYLTELLIPVQLHFYYGYPFLPGERLPLILYLYPLFFLAFSYFIGMALMRSVHKWFFLFCISFFLVHIGLVLQLIPMTRTTITADRYMYLPALPLLMIAVHLIVNYWRAPKIALVLYIIVLAVYANYLAGSWTNFNLIVHDKN